MPATTLTLDVATPANYREEVYSFHQQKQAFEKLAKKWG